MARRATVEVDILVDSRDAQRGLDQTSGKFSSFGNTMETLAKPAAIVTGALLAVGTMAVKSASNTEQAMGALDSVFGENAATVKSWAKGAADAAGLSQSAYGQLAAVAGASLKSMGLSSEDAAKSTGQLITLGSDLAATFGGTTADAVDALTAALRGEADPAERLGLKLNQTTVQARLLEKGQKDLTGSALDAAKATAIMELAHEQAGGAIGQFARETDTAAGSAAIAAANFENAKSALGEALLPVAVLAADALATLARWVGENSTLVMTFAGIIGGLALAVLSVNAAMSAWNAIQGVAKIATTAATAAQWLFNAALTANPIGLIIIAVAALVAGFILLWNKSDAFREFFIGMWEGIKRIFVSVWEAMGNVVKTVMGAIMSPIEAVKRAIDVMINGLKSAIDWAKNLAKSIPIIGGLFSVAGPDSPAGHNASQFWVPSTPGVAGLSGPSLPSLTAVAAAAAPVTIIIQGALDPVAVARQVDQLLTRQSRRQTGIRV